jgi:serine O-acetyltransferase
MLALGYCVLRILRTSDTDFAAHVGAVPSELVDVVRQSNLDRKDSAGADFWAALASDFERNGALLTRRRLIRALLVPDRFGALAWIRTYQLLERRGLATSLAFRVLLHAHGLEIDGNVEIGGGLYLPHPRGVLFAHNTSVGERCAIYGAVRFLSVDERAPVVEDDVFLGDGARLVGVIRIGHGARIGAGAVVTHDVPPGATAAGVPARVLSSIGHDSPSVARRHT